MRRASTIWWLLTGVVIATELATGTIYLLMISVGLAAGAIAAHLGLDLPVQISCAAVVGMVSIFLGRRIRRRRAPQLPAQAESGCQFETLVRPSPSSNGPAMALPACPTGAASGCSPAPRQPAQPRRAPHH